MLFNAEKLADSNELTVNVCVTESIQPYISVTYWVTSKEPVFKAYKSPSPVTLLTVLNAKSVSNV